MPGGLGFVEARHGQSVRGGKQGFGILPAFGHDLMDGIGEGVKRLLAFRFRGFGHEAFMHEKREVDGRGVIAALEQSFGDVESAHSFGCGGHEFMHADTVERHLQNVLELLPQVVGIEDGVVRNASDTSVAEPDHVGKGPDDNAKAAVERTDVADAQTAFGHKAKGAVRALLDPRRGQEGQKAFAAAHGAAAGAAAVKLGKEVVSAYADYEQLVGGVDTLFKDNSKDLQSYAANAYKTAGLSANEYMETVTSFSASLIQSLGGDTEKAVKYADMAITDMSDNANKMGTDMSMIQSAYQGFAKQNYTMLDNLKLGYGGTKSEMERLLADAEAISGIHYNLESYADVVDAIHVIQTSMDITGTTAKEAEHTISGSINALQAAGKNLLVGFGNADADMEQLCGNMAEALKNVISNITPVIENIVKALPTATKALLDAIAELLPTLLDTVTQLFSQLLTTILELLPQLIPAAVQAVMTITQAIIDNLPLLIDAATQMIVSLVQGLADALPQLIPAAVEAVTTIVQGLIDNLPLLLDAALQLILGLAQGLLDALPQLIESLPAIITGIVDFLISGIPQIIEAGIQLLTALVKALPDIISAIVEVLPQIIDGIVTGLLEGLPRIVQAGIDLLVALVQDLPEIIQTIVAALPQIVSAVVDALLASIPQLVETGVTLFISLIENLPTIILEIVKAVPQIIEGIVNAFTESIPQIVEVGANLVRGLWEGIQSLASWLWDKVSGWISSIWDGICDFFGIASPSKEMGWVGEMLVEGLAGSLDKNGKTAVRSAEHLADGISSVMQGMTADMQTAIPSHINMDTTLSGLSDVGRTSSGQAFNVTIPLTIDGTTLARILAEIQWTQNAAYVRNLGTV